MSFFVLNDTATTEIYTLSLHDALPIGRRRPRVSDPRPHRDRPGVGQGAALVAGGELRPTHEGGASARRAGRADAGLPDQGRSEEHTSELQSRQYLVCRLLLEKKQCQSP